LVENSQWQGAYETMLGGKKKERGFDYGMLRMRSGDLITFLFMCQIKFQEEKGKAWVIILYSGIKTTFW
jgi:hypothetical protein